MRRVARLVPSLLPLLACRPAAVDMPEPPPAVVDTMLPRDDAEPSPGTADPVGGEPERVATTYDAAVDPQGTASSLTAARSATDPADAKKAPFSIEALYRLAGVGQPQWSPSGSHVLFSITRHDLAAGSSNAELWLGDPVAGTTRQLTHHDGFDGEATWAPDGKSFVFVSTRGAEGPQLWRMSIDGGEPERLTSLSTGVAEPLPIAWAIERPPVAGQVRLAAVVTVVDAAQFLASRAVSASVDAQVTYADVVLVTKAELAGDQLAAVTAAIAGLAPRALVHVAPTDDHAAWLEGLLADPALPAAQPARHPAQPVAHAAAHADHVHTDDCRHPDSPAAHGIDSVWVAAPEPVELAREDLERGVVEHLRQRAPRRQRQRRAVMRLLGGQRGCGRERDHGGLARRVQSGREPDRIDHRQAPARAGIELLHHRARGQGPQLGRVDGQLGLEHPEQRVHRGEALRRVHRERAHEHPLQPLGHRVARRGRPHPPAHVRPQRRARVEAVLRQQLPALVRDQVDRLDDVLERRLADEVIEIDAKPARLYPAIPRVDDLLIRHRLRLADLEQAVAIGPRARAAGPAAPWP